MEILGDEAVAKSVGGSGENVEHGGVLGGVMGGVEAGGDGAGAEDGGEELAVDDVLELGYDNSPRLLI